MRTAFTKRRLINWYFVGPVIGYITTTVAIVAAVLHFAHHARDATVKPSHSVQISPTDGLARELAHCQAIGDHAANDAACIAAWAENRRRFFSGDATAARPPAWPAKSERASQP
jgi:conjugative transfer region protein TrbK